MWSFCLLLPGAWADGLPPAQTITIQAERITVGRALSQVSQQTGMFIEDRSRLPDGTIALDLQQVPFWKALDAIAAASNRRVNFYPTTRKVTLDRVGEGFQRAPVSYDGRFRCALTKIYATRDLETGRVTYTAGVEIAWEPSLLPLYLETRPQHLQVRDDRGRELPVTLEGSSLAPAENLLSMYLDIHLPAIPRRCPRLGVLSGSLNIIAPSKMLTFDFGSLAELRQAEETRRTKVQQQVRCTINRITRTRDRWTINVTVDYPPGGKQLDSYQSWVVNNEMILEEKDSKRQVLSSDYVVESDTARRAVLSYHFRDRAQTRLGSPEQWKVLYRTPASLVVAPIHFTFKDVPLP
jgi:hypothetical protein